MKQYLLFVLLNTALIWAYGQKVNNPFQHKTYYSIMPKNIISSYEISNDSIVISRLTLSWEPSDGERTVFKVLSMEQAGDTCYFCIENKASQDVSNGFLPMTLVKNGATLLITNGFEPYPTLAGCRLQKLHISEHFYFTLFTKAAIDSFRRFPAFSLVDTVTACHFKERAMKEGEEMKKQVEQIARYDKYLSNTAREMMNRIMIAMRINPVDYTSEDMKSVLEKCN